MKFKTQFSTHDRFFTCAGDPLHIIYSPKFDDEGRMYLVETGKEDTYSYIQSFADSVDLHVIISRFANGESDVLNQRNGLYGDFTEMPKTYAEMLEVMKNGEKFFNELPVDVKEKFDFDLNQFLASIGTEKFNDVFAQPVEKSVEDVSEQKVGDVDA